MFSTELSLVREIKMTIPRARPEQVLVHECPSGLQPVE